MTSPTIRQDLWDGKMCQQLDVGMLQEVIPVPMIEELLETYQMWETRERKLNMVVMIYWIIALHLYPRLSGRAVYAKLVSGLRTWRDDIAEQLPVKSAFSYRREQLGNDLLQELFEACAGPQADEQTPGAFWKGMRLLALDGTVESVPDTPENRVTFQYSTDDALSHSPYPLARLLLLVECGSHLICDAELSSCRQAEARSARLLLERQQLEHCLLLWDSGFHASAAIFQVRSLGGDVLGRVPQGALLHPIARLVDGSALATIYEGQKHHTGTAMLVRVITYTFTDPRIPGANTQVYRLVTTLLDPFVYPGKELAALYHERWHVELVIGETRTLLRLSVRTLRSRTPQGVIQEITALLLAHTVVRTLMLRAATAKGIAPVSLSFTETVRLLDNSLIPLGVVHQARRAQMVRGVLQEIATLQLPKQRLRIQARVVKRVRSRYERKKPEHWEAPPWECDLDFHQIILLI
jgi:Insertion element 4 transposase N-terminal/Transposase DDE domain